MSLVVGYVPLPSLHDLVGWIIKNPDQVVPVVVCGLRHPGDIASELAAWSIPLHLEALPVEPEVVALLYGGGALHALRVLVFGHPNEHRSVVLREYGCDRRRVAKSLFPAQRVGDKTGSQGGVHA